MSIPDQAQPTVDCFAAAETSSARRPGSLRDVEFRQPSPAALQRAAEAVAETHLSPELAQWVQRYGEVGQRSPYLWNWCRRGVEVTRLSCVPPDLREWLNDTKVLGVMLDVLVDDVADEHGDLPLLERLTDLPRQGWPASNAYASSPKVSRGSPTTYEHFTYEVWLEIGRRVRQLPRFLEFAEILTFDYTQLMNAMRYSHLLNRHPILLNLAEHNLYLPHNMHMMVSATIDLMGSPSFDQRELGLIREAVWNAQCMGRIGNLVTTWPREIRQRDFTSGVFAHAVTRGRLRVEDFEVLETDVLESLIELGGHERHFLDSWTHHRQCVLSLAEQVRSVDLHALIEGLDQLICLHLASRGRK